MESAGAKVVRFGVFELDLAARQLRKNGTRIKLQDQPFRVLQLLTERPGEIVTREELKEKLWSDDTFVEFDHSLNTSVQKIRRALRDSAESPRFVETIPRVGYRFVAPVEATGAQPPSLVTKPGTLSTSSWLAILAAVLIVAALAAWWMIRSPEPAFNPAAYQLRRLTYDNGLAFQPAISADGKHVVYASDRAAKGNLDIWLQQSSGGEPVQLTSGDDDELEPSFSPDGTRVVFRSGRDGGGIYVVPSLGGGTARSLAPTGYRPRFSPDGKRVAYWLGKEHVRGAGNRVFIVSAEGGEPIEIGLGRSPVWSPDGDGLLYLGGVGSPLLSEWVFSTLDGAEPSNTGALDVLRQSELAADPNIIGRDAFVPELWMSDGRVLFSAGSGQAFNIWSIYVSPQSGQVSGSAQRITTGSGEHRFASASIDGLLAFADTRQTRDVWILPADTNRGEASAEAARVTSSAAMDYSPSLSDDGTTLAFLSNRSGANEVWTKNFATEETKQLTATEKDSGGQVVARADGEFVAFTISGQRAAGASRETYAVSTADGSLRKLCADCGAISDWSRSGNLLVGYGQSSAGRALGLAGAVTLTDLTTNQSRVLFQNQPDWRFSLDERWLAFHNSGQGGIGIRQVFIARLPEEGEIDESELIAVTDGSDNSFRPAWSPDGNLLYFASGRDGHVCIYAQPLDRNSKHPFGPPRAVYHSHGTRLSLAGILNVGQIGLSIARDKIAFAMAETTGDIWIMEPPNAE